MKQLIKSVLALFASVIIFLLVVSILSIVIGAIAQIPFLRVILYWPSDALWVNLVIPPGSAVFAAAYVSTILCGNAKLFSASIILIYLLNLILSLVQGVFTWLILVSALAVILPAVICLNLTKETL